MAVVVVSAITWREIARRQKELKESQKTTEAEDTEQDDA